MIESQQPINMLELQYDNPTLFDKLMAEAEDERTEVELARKERERDCE